MTWSFKYVGNYEGIKDALLSGGGQHDGQKIVVPDSYKVARDVILTQLCQQTQAPEIGWQVEAWGGGPSFHVDIQPVNLRVTIPTKSAGEKEKR